MFLEHTLLWLYVKQDVFNLKNCVFSGNIATEIEDGEFNKDLLPNGDEEYPLNGDVRNLEQWHFPREDLIEEGILGHGKYGKVYIAKARGINEGEIEVVVAVKQLAAENEEARQAFDQELEMLTQLKHPNVIKLLGVCVKDFPLLMITEYSEHVSASFASLIREVQGLCRRRWSRIL